MSKSIKVSDKAYDRLTALLQPKESYSGVVERLLDIKEGVAILTRTVEGQKHYAEQRKQELQAPNPEKP